MYGLSYQSHFFFRANRRAPVNKCELVCALKKKVKLFIGVKLGIFLIIYMQFFSSRYDEKVDFNIYILKPNIKLCVELKNIYELVFHN